MPMHPVSVRRPTRIAASASLTLLLLPFATPVLAQAAAPPEPERLTLPPATGDRASPLPPAQVDPVTGRPVTADGASTDSVDVAARRRLSEDVRRGRSGTVPAYIPLPSGSTQQSEVPRPRVADRALGGRRLPGDTVRERSRPEYDAPGIRTGGIVVHPYVSGGVAYDANVYAEENSRSDVFGYALAGIDAASDWGRHRASLSGFVRRRQYTTYDSENTTTYRLIGTGRYDVSSHVALTSEASHQRIQLERGAVEEVSTQALPTLYDFTTGQLGGRIDYGPTRVNLLAGVSRTRFRDNVSLSGDFTDQSFRNFRGYAAQLRIEHDVFGQRALYAELDVERRRFDTAAARLRSNGDVYNLVAGLRGELTQLIRGHVGAGVIHVEFEDPAAEPLTGLTFDAQLDWLLRERTTLSFSAGRELRTVAQRGVRSALFTSLDLRADEEVRRNLIVSLGLRQQWTDYVDDTRRASATGVTLGAEWLLDRHWTVRPQLSYLRRTDRGFGIDLGPEDAQAGVSGSYRF